MQAQIDAYFTLLRMRSSQTWWTSRSYSYTPMDHIPMACSFGRRENKTKTMMIDKIFPQCSFQHSYRFYFQPQNQLNSCCVLACVRCVSCTEGCGLRPTEWWASFFRLFRGWNSLILYGYPGLWLGCWNGSALWDTPDREGWCCGLSHGKTFASLCAVLLAHTPPNRSVAWTELTSDSFSPFVWRLACCKSLHFLHQGSFFLFSRLNVVLHTSEGKRPSFSRLSSSPLRRHREG